MAINLLTTEYGKEFLGHIFLLATGGRCRTRDLCSSFAGKSTSWCLIKESDCRALMATPPGLVWVRPVRFRVVIFKVRGSVSCWSFAKKQTHILPPASVHMQSYSQVCTYMHTMFQFCISLFSMHKVRAVWAGHDMGSGSTHYLTSSRWQDGTWWCSGPFICVHVPEVQMRPACHQQALQPSGDDSSFHPKLAFLKMLLGL